MLTIKELRSGNCVLINEDARKIWAVGVEEVYDSDGNSWDIEVIKPIEITKELYFNLKIPKKITSNSIPLFFDYNDVNHSVDFIVETEKSQIILSEFKYLHQLQNFYFALSKEELQLEKEYVSVEENKDDILDFYNSLFNNND